MMEIGPALNPIQARIHIAGSKSISNRLLLLQHVFKGELLLSNLSDSEDTQLLAQALEQIKQGASHTIDVKHAGTDMRFLTALLCITEGEWIISGSERMKERPIGELVRVLKLLGADIRFSEKENYPPLLIKGKKLSGGKVEIDAGISSQFISALLLIAPAFENGLYLHLKGKVVSRPYITMSLALLSSFGVKWQQTDDSIEVFPMNSFKALQNVEIESDWTSASYYYSICALSKRAHIELSRFDQHSLQADSILPQLFKDLGVESSFNEDGMVLRSIPVSIREFFYDCSHCPDIAQTLAVTCFGLGIACHLTGLSTLKIKESDRLLALKTELEKFGAKVDIGLDFIRVLPEISNKKQETKNKKQVTIETYNDHRMAMSFAPLALNYGKIFIHDPSVVNKSYPRFWEDLKSLGFNVNLRP